MTSFPGGSGKARGPVNAIGPDAVRGYRVGSYEKTPGLFAAKPGQWAGKRDLLLLSEVAQNDADTLRQAWDSLQGIGRSRGVGQKKARRQTIRKVAARETHRIAELAIGLRSMLHHGHD